MKKNLSFVFILIYAFYSSGKTQEFTEHQIASNYNSWSTMAIDMDNDGDIDIVGSSRFGNKVAWWENDGSENFTEQIISTTSWYAMGISAADLDGDEDIDVVCAAQEANAVLWWENDGSQSFTQHIAANIISPSYVYLADVDSDEDQDILVAACEDNSYKIVWLENIGSPEFTLHIIKENWVNANSIYAADMDSDGDVDVIATASFRLAPQNGEISWFENDGNQNFTEHNIINNYGRPSCAIATDIDDDGDMDVIAAVCTLHRIIWFENDGSQNFTDNIIATAFIRPHNICAADMDNDGDQDILGAAINLNQVAWFENDSNDFTKHIVSNSFGGATCVYAEDIDKDGDQDILGAAQFDNQIKWWENSLITGQNDEGLSLSNGNINFNCYPNPFIENCTFKFSLEKEAFVSINILNSSGTKVISILNENLRIGEYSFFWDGKNSDGAFLSSGIYFLEFKTGQMLRFQKTIKLVKY